MMIKELNFRPLFKSNHLQTILGSFGFPLKDPPSKNEIITLPDGDKLCCRMFQPENWTKKNKIVLLLHGVGGSDRSHYMRRITKKLYNQGYFVYCINRRGCGGGIGLSSKLSHGGLTDDVLFVLKHLKQRYPDVPLEVVGFSLGGNILLKLLGECGSEGKKYVSRAIAVCPLLDLKDAAEALRHKENRLYEANYVKSFIQHVKRAQKAFSDQKQIHFPKKCSIIDFDNIYTAPTWGFKNAYDYFEQNSSVKYVSKIEVPCDLLCTEDDPFIRFDVIKRIDFPTNITVWKTKYGGHMGFLGKTKHLLDFRYMDEQVIRLIEKSK